METVQDIYFYGQNDIKYGYMSNFYKTKFTDNNGITYNCSEQYFMYQKCLYFNPTNNTLLYNIINEENPKNIKRYGRQVKNFNDKLWNEVKYDIMIKALLYKFNQNNDIKNKLLNTGNKNLYEASEFDKIWGIGFSIYMLKTGIDKNKFGHNLLGKALMHVRNILN